MFKATMPEIELQNCLDNYCLPISTITEEIACSLNIKLYKTSNILYPSIGECSVIIIPLTNQMGFEHLKMAIAKNSNIYGTSSALVVYHSCSFILPLSPKEMASSRVLHFELHHQTLTSNSKWHCTLPMTVKYRSRSTVGSVAIARGIL